jgi:hypothetical protein
MSISARKRSLLTVVVLAAVVALSAPTEAQAATPTQDITWTDKSADGVISTRVTLRFPQGAPSSSAIDALRTNSTASGAVTAAGPGPQGAWLYCNTFYSFSTVDATWSFQHQCGGKTGPWGIDLAAKWCAVAIGVAAEQGMDWTYNGVKQGRQAPHAQGCIYQFHGTYNPDYDYDWITYSDTFQLPVNIGGRAGVATFYTTGSFTSSGQTPPD